MRLARAFGSMLLEKACSDRSEPCNLATLVGSDLHGPLGSSSEVIGGSGHLRSFDAGWRRVATHGECETSGGRKEASAAALSDLFGWAKRPVTLVGLCGRHFRDVCGGDGLFSDYAARRP